jgi:hypothetical protein
MHSTRTLPTALNRGSGRDAYYYCVVFPYGTGFVYMSAIYYISNVSRFCVSAYGGHVHPAIILDAPYIIIIERTA